MIRYHKKNKIKVSNILKNHNKYLFDSFTDSTQGLIDSTLRFKISRKESLIYEEGRNLQCGKSQLILF